MNRREFIKIAGGAALSLALMNDRVLGQDQSPNIIYILLDDAGYGDLSCYGQKKFSTPNMDRIAAEGIRFTSHYSGSTVCAPSRCSLLTGLHTGHTAIRGNREVDGQEGQWPLPADAVTVSKLLQRAGYRTGAFGKWGLGPDGSSGDPLNQGFDEFFGYLCQNQAHNYYPDHLWHNGEKVMLDGETYSHDLIVNKAFEFIRANADGKFFCYLPVAIPHASLHAPEDSVAPFRTTFPQFETKMGIYQGPMIYNPAAHFAGMMSRLDGQVGQLLLMLQELGIDNNTVVMLASDNGPHNEGGAMPKFFDSNGPFRGMKRDLYEGGIRVPMMARWPGRIAPGLVTDHVSAFWDVLPTMCDLGGAIAPEGIDGVSFVPILLGLEGEQMEHEYLYWEYPGMNGRQAARSAQWKAVRLDVSKNLEAPLELYDLDFDPGEENDLASQQPDVAAKMLEIMQSAHTESEVFKLFKS